MSGYNDSVSARSGDTIIGLDSGDVADLATSQGGATIAVSGSGGTVDDVNDSDTVNLYANTSVTVNGNGGTIGLYGSGDTVFTSNQTLNTAQGVSGVTVIGYGDIVNVFNDVQISIGGGNDTIAMRGTNDFVGLVGGTGYVVNGDNAGDTAGMTSNTSVTVNGYGGAVGLYGNGNTVLTSNEIVYASAGVSNDTVIGYDDTLNESSDAAVSVGGGNDTTVMQGTNDFVGLLGGTGYVVNGDDAGDTAGLLANTTVTVNGYGGAVGVYGSTDTVTTSNETVTAPAEVQGVTVAGSGDSISLAGGGSGLTVLGNSDTVDSVDGNTIGFAGTADTAQVNDGQVYLDTAGTSVTVVGDNDTANAATGGDTLGFAGAADTAQIANGQIYLDTPGTSVTVEGDGNTVNTPQPNTVVGFTGIGNVAQVSNGTIVVNNESGPSLAVEGSGDAVTTVNGGTVASPVLDDATVSDIDAIYNAVLDRDPSASDYVSAQVLLAGGGGLGSLMAAVAGSAESRADMASTYAAVGEAAPSQAEFGAFADAMSGSYGAPLELFSVDPVTGAQVVLADTSTTNLLAELPVLETEANGLNLGLQLADGAQIGFSSTARLADFLYAVSVQQLQATSFVTDNYNLDRQWLDTVDQPLLNEAVSWSEQAAALVNAPGGSSAYAQSLEDEDNTAASEALKIAAEAPGSRQDMTVTIKNPYTGNPTQVTVYSAGGDKIHDISGSVWQPLESALSTILNVVAAVSGQEYLYFVAAAIDAAQAGQDISNGQDIAGILSLAQAVAAGITGAAGGTTPTTPAPLSAQIINAAAQGVGGVYGLVQSAENGNALGILAGALEAAAAGATGVALGSSGTTQTTLNAVATALGVAGTAANLGNDFDNGNLGQGLVDSLNLYLPEVAQAYVNYQNNLAQAQQPLIIDAAAIEAASVNPVPNYVPPNFLDAIQALPAGSAPPANAASLTVTTQGSTNTIEAAPVSTSSSTTGAVGIAEVPGMGVYTTDGSDFTTGSSGSGTTPGGGNGQPAQVPSTTISSYLYLTEINYLVGDAKSTVYAVVDTIPPASTTSLSMNPTPMLFLDNNGDPILNYKGQKIMMPSNAYPTAIADFGNSYVALLAPGPLATMETGLDSMTPTAAAETLLPLFRQNGPWDFQRNVGSIGNTVSAFTDYANVEIGIYGASTGIPLNTLLSIANNYANANSKYTGPMDSIYTHLSLQDASDIRLGYTLINSGLIGHH